MSINYDDSFTKNECIEFDFDEWMALNRRDPEAFEARRQALVEQVIETAPQAMQRRLRGLMFEIDAERAKAKTPLQACMNISSLMWERFDALRLHMNILTHPEKLSESEKIQLHRSTEEEPAVVLPFKARPKAE